MKRRWVLGVALILAWQASFFVDKKAIRRLKMPQRMTAAVGACYDVHFAYFQYYLGIYPITSAAILATRDEQDRMSDEAFAEARSVVASMGPRLWSADGARELISAHGEMLLEDVGLYATRYGEHLQAYLSLPSAYLRGSPQDAAMRPFNAFVFAFALAALFWALCYVDRPGMAMAAVLFLGSNPFQVNEIYGEENVFGWLITTMILLLAAHLPFLVGKHRDVALWLPVASGLLLGTVAHIRVEPLVLAASVAGAYAFVARLPPVRRALLLGVFAVTVGGTFGGWRVYFGHKIDEATTIVKENHGHSFEGPRTLSHALWHPVFTGLGDYGRDKGYAWLDWVAYEYAEPILAERFGVRIPQRKGYAYTETWDAAGLYPRKPEEMPHYGEVVRQKVLSDILGDPLWYAGILVRRCLRVLDDMTPLTVAFARHRLALPAFATTVLTCLAFWVLWRRRAWADLKVAAFTLPAALPAILIFSGAGMTYYSVVHILLASSLVALAPDMLRSWLASRRVSPTPTADVAVVAPKAE